jgi:hypothetical protein
MSVVAPGVEPGAGGDLGRDAAPGGNSDVDL